MNLIYSKNTTWFKSVLYVAGVYHVFWGLSVIFFPCFWFDLGSLAHPNYIQLWRVVGLYEFVFGLGFLLAASNPLRHWRVVLMENLSVNPSFANIVRNLFVQRTRDFVIYNATTINNYVYFNSRLN